MIETITQTWKTKDLSNASMLFQISQDSWRKHNPRWTYQILDDSDIANYVQAHTPHFYKNIYVKYRAQIQRVDIFRIIHQIFDGGIYSDLDAEAIRPFQGKGLESDGIVLGSLANKKSPQRIPNAFLYSGKTHGIFWAFVLAEARKRFLESKGYDGAEWLTGPLLLTYCYHAYIEMSKDEIKSHILDYCPDFRSSFDSFQELPIQILGPNVIYPIDWTTTANEQQEKNLEQRINQGVANADIVHPDTICINYWTHSWEIPKHTLGSRLSFRWRWMRHRLAKSWRK
tara:strand:- start:252 stop:1106 length:855 start_codon:yes stop_codon:yes gene_type:complete